ncbi:MAG: tetratricopeptide repeat protein [Pseudomonadota bacterium]
MPRFYRAAGRYADAEPLYTRVLTIRLAKLGPDHPLVVLTLITQAELYRDQKRREDAEAGFKRAIAIEEKAQRHNQHDLATCLNDLGELYRDQFRYAEAEPLFQRALAIDLATLPPDHPKLGVSLFNAGTVLIPLGRYDEAERDLKQAQAIAEAAGQKRPREVALVLIQFGRLEQAKGHYAVAGAAHHARADPARERVRPRRPAGRRRPHDLADLYRDQKRYDAAEPLYKRALSIYRTTLGGDDPKVYATIASLNTLYRLKGP